MVRSAEDVTGSVSGGVTRRRFVRGAAALGLSAAGAALLAACRDRYAVSGADLDAPPETASIRLPAQTTLCVAPMYIAEELLRAEGFTDVQIVRKATNRELHSAMAAGEIDLSMMYAPMFITRFDAGDPFVALAGGHVGCTELVGTRHVQTIRDLKGKSVTVAEIGSPPYLLGAMMASHVGLNPHTDLNWVVRPLTEGMQLLADEKVDALIATPPAAQELRAKGIGHVVVSTTLDKPWSQYFCCMVVCNRAWVQKHPAATKRALRAILKAADSCSQDPEGAARLLVDRNYSRQYDSALQAMREVPYGRWREFDPEDTLRFQTLRLKEAGFVKSSPKSIISRGTNWRFLNELKKELKT
jgi:NitT/TauT family transport system substrate-binding protein